MVYVILLVVLAAVVLVISGPLRRPAGLGGAAGGGAGSGPDGDGVGAGGVSNSDMVELEAARDAKYREIRDAELDHDTGKLSDEDFQAIDQTLRAEAIELMRQLDGVRATPHV